MSNVKAIGTNIEQRRMKDFVKFVSKIISSKNQELKSIHKENKFTIAKLRIA